MHRIFHHLLRSPIPVQRYSVLTMASSSGFEPKFTNRLSLEKSPYLLQHAHNPVDWYPWGEEAFKKAKEQNKLIFLSVGYSTCHWCHVMEKESFENEKVAAIMNEHFINVKVDREERPDVDQVYMNFVTSMSGSGGWPMSVWLTPDLHPVYGGTYFPPNNRYYGRPGFPTLLETLAKQWASEEEKIRSSGSAILSVLQKNLTIAKDDEAVPDSIECSTKCLAQLTRSYEPEYGGFSQSPKFPQVSNLNFLFTYYLMHPSSEEGKKAKEMALHTLTMMAQGGIHDHVAQGFARYSTDKQWHVPHFEKMLYDQAQLVHSYLDAYLVSRDSKYSELVRDILLYVTRDLSHESGGFYSAEDADSFPTADSKDKKEGAFCVWTKEQIEEVLSKEPLSETSPPDAPSLLEVFCHHFSVIENGNVDPIKDPHDELKHQNVLMAHGTLEETAEEFNLQVSEVKEALGRACRKLYEKRQQRPRPHLDDKMVTAWNGMMLSAISRAGAVLSDSDYLARADAAAQFLYKHLLADNGRLYRAAYRDAEGAVTLGPHKTEGFCDDYAWVIRGLIALYEATLNQTHLMKALELQETQDQLFWDSDKGGYFTTKSGESYILLRMKDDHDGAEPSVNSVSAGNLLTLHRLLDKPELLAKVETIFKIFSERLQKIPISLTEMASVQLMSQQPTSQVILSGQPNSCVMKELVGVVHNFPHHNRVLLSAPPDKGAPLYMHQPSLLKYRPKEAKKDAAEPSKDTEQVLESAKAFVCHHFTCSLPMTEPEQLRQNLQKAFQTASSNSS